MKNILSEIKKNGYKLLDKNIDRATLRKCLNIVEVEQMEMGIDEQEEEMLIDSGDFMGKSSLENFKLINSKGIKENQKG